MTISLPLTLLGSLGSTLYAGIFSYIITLNFPMCPKASRKRTRNNSQLGNDQHWHAFICTAMQ